MTCVAKATSLSLGYGKTTVLAEVNLEISQGEFWFLVGPNGAGKSTLLRGLLGDLRPQRGAVFLHPELACRQRIGFVPQRCNLSSTLPMTVGEFVGLGFVGTPVRRRDMGEHLQKALAHVGLADLQRRDYWALSGGQRQRCLVARALVREPKFLVADEPTAGLDLAATHALLTVLQELNRVQKMTVLFVTHRLSLAVRYSTHIAISNCGEVVAGTSGQVLNPEMLERAYGVPIELCRDSAGGLNVHVGVRNDTP